MTEETKKKVHAANFVAYVMEKIQDDTGFRAAMTRADNPDTESQAWRYLVHFCDLERPWERLPLGLVGAAIARKRIAQDGTQRLGEALRFCKQSLQEEDDSVERKLRRLLACDSSAELVPVLRPVLRLVQNAEKVSLNYTQLLRDILYFSEKVKLQWAKQYYSKKQEDDACTSPE
ncbi:MAG: type I-E CRISPR-associated protein Cse2/CasB [Planctomycetia bacterium]|nr:type I-E CRISPR-associated protein Cse2/CasB [Planctomycetia bacterium]